MGTAHRTTSTIEGNIEVTINEAIGMLEMLRQRSQRGMTINLLRVTVQYEQVL